MGNDRAKFGQYVRGFKTDARSLWARYSTHPDASLQFVTGRDVYP